ncbi:MAG TPA: GDP-mannose 4,6-dehydratase, partial [Oscillospiraceae bacterium]|nr:GDP-mannose 4,6-dehydratase [Oscillospiraceae bacterium]
EMGKPEELISFVSDRPGHDLRYAINPSKIQNELGWNAVYDFDSGIKTTIEWYLNNMDWLKNITDGEYKNYYEKMYGGRG